MGPKLVVIPALNHSSFNTQNSHKCFRMRNGSHTNMRRYSILREREGKRERKEETMNGCTNTFSLQAESLREEQLLLYQTSINRTHELLPPPKADTFHPAPGFFFKLIPALLGTLSSSTLLSVKCLPKTTIVWP